MMRMNQMMGIRSTNYRKSNAECRNDPKGNYLLSHMTSPGLAPRPSSVEIVRRKCRHDIAKDRRLNLTGDDSKAIDDCDYNNRCHRGRHRDQGVTKESSTMFGLRPGDHTVDRKSHESQSIGFRHMSGEASLTPQLRPKRHPDDEVSSR